MSVKLWNKSARIFTVGNPSIDFKPDTTRNFSDEEGNRLAKMYPGELVDIAKLDSDAPDVAAGEDEVIRNPVTGAVVEDPNADDFENQGGRKVSEAAQELANENGIDIETVVGTGSNGNVTKADVQKVIDEQAD